MEREDERVGWNDMEVAVVEQRLAWNVEVEAERLGWNVEVDEEVEEVEERDECGRASGAVELGWVMVEVVEGGREELVAAEVGVLEADSIIMNVLSLLSSSAVTRRDT